MKEISRDFCFVLLCLQVVHELPGLLLSLCIPVRQEQVSPPTPPAQLLPTHKRSVSSNFTLAKKAASFLISLTAPCTRTPSHFTHPNTHSRTLVSFLSLYLSFCLSLVDFARGRLLSTSYLHKTLGVGLQLPSIVSWHKKYSGEGGDNWNTSRLYTTTAGIKSTFTYTASNLGS